MSINEIEAEIQKLQKLHKDQKFKLKLTLEKNIGDVVLSNDLQRLIFSEQQQLSQNNENNLLQLSNKIDQLMKKEYDQGYAQTFVKFKKHYFTLYSNQEKERINLLQTSSHIISKIPRSESRRPINLTPPEDTSIDGLIEQYRKRCEKNLCRDEELNFEVAFSHQKKRIEEEWKGHEDDLTSEYLQRKSLLTGNRETTPVQKYDQKKSPLWKEKEKQQKLIHTAPVLAPTKTTSLTDTELQNLESTYLEAMKTLNLQRKDAYKWLERQQMRMLIQLNYFKDLQKYIDSLEIKEKNHYGTIQDALNEVITGKDFPYALNTPFAVHNFHHKFDLSKAKV